MRLDTALSASMSTLGARGALPEVAPRLWLNSGSFRGILALLIFASFSTFWTALVLSAAPFSYSHTSIGLFWTGWTGRGVEQHPPEDLR